MFKFIDVGGEIDEKDLLKKLQNTKLSMKTISRRMISKVSQKIKGEAKGNIRSHKRTGELNNAIGYKAYPNFTAIIFAKKYYASFIENGVPLIQPKKNKYLVFQIDGEWKKVESVSISPKPFLKPVIDEYFNGEGHKAVRIMDDVLQQSLNKIYGRA